MKALSFVSLVKPISPEALERIASHEAPATLERYHDRRPHDDIELISPSLDDFALIHDDNTRRENRCADTGDQATSGAFIAVPYGIS